MSGSTNDERECCWICLDVASSTRPLVRPCKCPRSAHELCLARWQLRSVGKSEEQSCRFCLQKLPDWKKTLSVPSGVMASPVIDVLLNGKVQRLKLDLESTDGQRKFKEQLKASLGLPQELDFDISFKVKDPLSGQTIRMDGLDCYQAATHCAAISAAKRRIRKSRNHKHPRGPSGAAEGAEEGAAAGPSGRSNRDTVSATEAYTRARESDSCRGTYSQEMHPTNSDLLTRSSDRMTDIPGPIATIEDTIPVRTETGSDIPENHGVNNGRHVVETAGAVHEAVDRTALGALRANGLRTMLSGLTGRTFAGSRSVTTGGGVGGRVPSPPQEVLRDSVRSGPTPFAANTRSQADVGSSPSNSWRASGNLSAPVRRQSVGFGFNVRNSPDALSAFRNYPQMQRASSPEIVPASSEGEASSGGGAVHRPHTEQPPSHHRHPAQAAPVAPDSQQRQSAAPAPYGNLTVDVSNLNPAPRVGPIDPSPSSTGSISAVRYPGSAGSSSRADARQTYGQRVDVSEAEDDVALRPAAVGPSLFQRATSTTSLLHEPWADNLPLHGMTSSRSDGHTPCHNARQLVNQVAGSITSSSSANPAESVEQQAEPTLRRAGSDPHHLSKQDRDQVTRANRADWLLFVENAKDYSEWEHRGERVAREALTARGGQKQGALRYPADKQAVAENAVASQGWKHRAMSTNPRFRDRALRHDDNGAEREQRDGFDGIGAGDICVFRSLDWSSSRGYSSTPRSCNASPRIRAVRFEEDGDIMRSGSGLSERGVKRASIRRMSLDFDTTFTERERRLSGDQISSLTRRRSVPDPNEGAAYTSPREGDDVVFSARDTLRHSRTNSRQLSPFSVYGNRGVDASRCSKTQSHRSATVAEPAVRDKYASPAPGQRQHSNRTRSTHSTGSTTTTPLGRCPDPRVLPSNPTSKDQPYPAAKLARDQPLKSTGSRRQPDFCTQGQPSSRPGVARNATGSADQSPRFVQKSSGSGSRLSSPVSQAGRANSDSRSSSFSHSSLPLDWGSEPCSPWGAGSTCTDADNTPAALAAEIHPVGSTTHPKLAPTTPRSHDESCILPTKSDSTVQQPSSSENSASSVTTGPVALDQAGTAMDELKARSDTSQRIVYTHHALAHAPVLPAHGLLSCVRGMFSRAKETDIRAVKMPSPQLASQQTSGYCWKAV